MVPAGNKARRLSSVNHTTKTIHQHHQYEPWIRFRYEKYFSRSSGLMSASKLIFLVWKARLAIFSDVMLMLDQCGRSLRSLLTSLFIYIYRTFHIKQTKSSMVICPKEINQSLNQIKAFYVLGTKIIERRFTGIYRHLPSKCSEIAVLGRLEIV